MRNKWQIEYRNIRQGPTEMVDAYAARFRKAISKAEIGNLLPAQMQVIDFVAGLRLELVIITNGSNPADLDEVEETAKNVESVSLINRNVIATATNPNTAKIKELKAQILELKAEIKEVKYVLREDRKAPQNNERNRKPSYRGPNRKPVNKRNLECFNCRKKGHFKSKCRAKLKDRTDYRNIRFLESEQPEIESSSDSKIEEINLYHQRVRIPNRKYNTAQDLWWISANTTFGDLVQIPKYKEQIRDMLDHDELREVVDNIKDKKDNRRVNFVTKHPAARIYGKIGRTECQLVIDTGAEVSVYTKPMADLLKLKLKPDKTMTVIAIDGIKQKSLRSAGLVTVKVLDQPTQVEMQIVQSKDQVIILTMNWIQKYKAVINMNEE